MSDGMAHPFSFDAKLVQLVTTILICAFQKRHGSRTGLRSVRIFTPFHYFVLNWPSLNLDLIVPVGMFIGHQAFAQLGITSCLVMESPSGSITETSEIDETVVQRAIDEARDEGVLTQHSWFQAGHGSKIFK